MRIGLTGSKGFIGSYMANCLNDPIIFEGDMTKIRDLFEFVSYCDRIYHFAGKNREELGEILQNNIISTSNLVLATKIQSVNPEIIFASSQQVVWNSNSEYGFVKSAEEDIIKKANKWCIFRIPNVYGPGCRPFYNSVIATFCYQLSKGEPITIHDPAVKREFVFIEDLAEELMNPEFNCIKNIAGENMTIGDIYFLLTDGLGTHKKLERCLQHYKDKELED